MYGKIYIAQGLQDRSGKPGEDLSRALCRTWSG